jgi:iron(III) transport system permease protein
VSQFLRVASAHGLALADSVLWAAVAGLIAAGLALGACWCARGSRRFAAFLIVLTTVAWVTPAPLTGLGLKTAIGWLVSVEDAVLGPDVAFPPARSLLYDQPSPLPGVWACIVRFFPVAVALSWPGVRSVPRELIDAAELDGGRRAVWRAAVWPWARGAFVRAAVAVAILALGEVVASKLVQPPGRQSFAQELFNAMHYGADATVAVLCLLQIAVTAVPSAMLMFLLRRARTG